MHTLLKTVKMSSNSLEKLFVHINYTFYCDCLNALGRQNYTIAIFFSTWVFGNKQLLNVSLKLFVSDK